jgi:ketosteroid isomerase-like protein
MQLKHLALAAVAPVMGGAIAFADVEEDRHTVAMLDTAYQAAVERNDAAAMDAILHEQMIVVFGDGTVGTRDDLLEAARLKSIVYQDQVEEEGTQTVRLYGPDTAVVTALLRVKGTRNDGSLIDIRLWFSDTYVRTPQGWRYAFGQASRPEPVETDTTTSNSPSHPSPGALAPHGRGAVGPRTAVPSGSAREQLGFDNLPRHSVAHACAGLHRETIVKPGHDSRLPALPGRSAQPLERADRV